MTRATSRSVTGRASVRLLLVVGFMACLGLGMTAVKSSYATDFFFNYPSSQSDDNVLGGTGKTCQLCHRDSNGGEPWNGYGWDIKQLVDGGMSASDAMLAVEALDSDGDPGGTSNIDEINGGNQPGWTNGPNNTIFFDDGSTQTGQLPPSGILGDLDPVDPWADLGQALAGTNGDPVLVGSGSLADGTLVSLTLSNALANSTTTLIIGLSQLNAPFKGGVMVPNPDFLIFLLPTGPTGTLPLAATWAALPSGFVVYFQHWISDPAGPAGFAASNAVSAAQP
jgi:hypothetical protein